MSAGAASAGAPSSTTGAAGSPPPLGALGCPQPTTKKPTAKTTSNKLKPFIKPPFRKKTEVFVMRELRNHAIRICFHAIDPSPSDFIPQRLRKC
jgi:hypothetical protein